VLAVVEEHPMPNTSLRSALNDLAHNFASSVLDAIRGASLADLHAEGGSGGVGNGRRARGPGRPKGSGLRAQGAGGGMPDPLHVVPKKTKGGRLARRSPADIAKALDAVVSLVKKSNAGLRSEEIRKALKLDVREVPRVLKEGLAKKKLKSKGQKRATVYSAA
jgi:hypothetical protein